jgi:deoxyribodipyrimidine photo-lyase
MKINIFWFRRDLRLDDNTGLNIALNSDLPVLPLFIFDTNITDELKKDDPRISFIWDTLSEINNTLKKSGHSLCIIKGEPLLIWKSLINKFEIHSVYTNSDYEPYSIERDLKVASLLSGFNISFHSFKDQVIFEKDEIQKSDKTPYTVFTPYKTTWLQNYKLGSLIINSESGKKKHNFFSHYEAFPSLRELGFTPGRIKVRQFDLSAIEDYEKYRDLPGEDKTTYLSPHLRFGTISIRELVTLANKTNQVFLSELIWREFFMQILFRFPEVVTHNFRRKYDDIRWRNDEKEFEKWCKGETGYPLVDAGMRQLNETGYMHNRVRMVTAGFLCKHLLIDWRWGEAYFAEKLLDYELSSNNGNWQWAAGTGCDAAPYFRVFNPYSQQRKFDPEKKYIRRWIKDLDNPGYPKPIIDHESARQRGLMAYKSGLRSSLKN